MNKILYVVSTLERKGPTNQLYNIISNLKNRWDIYLLTLSPEPENSMYDDFSELDNVRLLSLSLSRIEGVFVAKNKIFKILKEIRPSIVHTQGLRADSLISKLHLESQWVSTARNYPLDDYPMKFGRLLGHLMAYRHLKIFSKCNYLVSCSKTIKNKLESVGVNSHPIQNGVTIRKTAPDIEIDAFFEKIEGPVFITVGSLIHRKNMQLLISAYTCWKRERKSSGCLLIVGDGPERLRLEQRSGDDIFFMGEVQNVFSYLEKSDYFISTSLSEGLPNTVLEAMASEIPVILSDIDSHLEIYNETQKSCLIFELNDGEEGLLEKIDFAPSFFDAEAKAEAGEVIMKCFSDKVMSDKYERLYEKILESK